MYALKLSIWTILKMDEKREIFQKRNSKFSDCMAQIVPLICAFVWEWISQFFVPELFTFLFWLLNKLFNGIRCVYNKNWTNFEYITVDCEAFVGAMNFNFAHETTPLLQCGVIINHCLILQIKPRTQSTARVSSIINNSITLYIRLLGGTGI